MSSVSYWKRNWWTLWLRRRYVTDVIADPQRQREVEREIAEHNRCALQMIERRRAVNSHSESE